MRATDSCGTHTWSAGIVEVDYSLDLIIHDRLEGEDPLKIVPVFGMEGGDERNPPFLGLSLGELARGKRRMRVDDVEVVVLQLELKAQVDIRDANAIGEV